MTQMQRRVPTDEGKRPAINQFQGGKPPAEGIMGPGPKNHDALFISIRHMARFAFSGNGGYSIEMAKAAEVAKRLDGETFKDVAFKFTDVPSIMSILSLCSLLPEKAEAREYAANSLCDKKPPVRGQAIRAIVDGFFVSDFLLPAIHRRIEWGAPENLPKLQKHCASLSERYGALRRSAFVEMKDVYGLNPHQYEIMKLNAGGIFARKFEAFYRENQGWNWIYDRSV